MPLYSAYIEKLLVRVKQIPVRDPNDPKTLIGPIINAAEVRKHREIVQQAKALFGGELNSALGHFNGRWIFEEFSRRHWMTLPVYTSCVIAEEGFGPLF